MLTHRREGRPQACAGREYPSRESCPCRASWAMACRTVPNEEGMVSAQRDGFNLCPRESPAAFMQIDGGGGRLQASWEGKTQCTGA